MSGVCNQEGLVRQPAGWGGGVQLAGGLLRASKSDRNERNRQEGLCRGEERGQHPETGVQKDCENSKGGLAVGSDCLVLLRSAGISPNLLSLLASCTSAAPQPTWI